MALSSARQEIGALPRVGIDTSLLNAMLREERPDGRLGSTSKWDFPATPSRPAFPYDPPQSVQEPYWHWSSSKIIEKAEEVAVDASRRRLPLWSDEGMSAIRQVRVCFVSLAFPFVSFPFVSFPFLSSFSLLLLLLLLL